MIETHNIIICPDCEGDGKKAIPLSSKMKGCPNCQSWGYLIREECGDPNCEEKKHEK